MAGVGERLCLGQGGDGDRTGLTVAGQRGDLGRLGSLHVQTQRNAETGKVAAEPPEIAPHAVAVERGERRIGIGERTHQQRPSMPRTPPSSDQPGSPG